MMMRMVPAAYAVVSITIAIAPKAATESPGEKDNHDDEKDQSERHGMVLWRGDLRWHSFASAAMR